MTRVRKYTRVAKPPRLVFPESPIIPDVPIDTTVKIHFNQPVEIYINRREYLGTDIIAPDYTVAAEIVRIAREAYGSDII